jgi:3-phenylpropionate/trans-cinnamate dioxygenase ferredoxin subunit
MSSFKTYSWVKLADNIAGLRLPAQGGLELEVDGKRVCIRLYKEKLYACSATCPHAGGAMADGYTDALGNIVCPLHGYKFSLQNGRNTSGEGYFLRIFPIEQREDGIYIGL